uniref:G_PROTEIN_RECEP_F1_2 domain-containing protein n=1 Tax=Steinernema glaseri TaxID=37863 RepID=A0A1I7Z7H9_9BILA
MAFPEMNASSDSLPSFFLFHKFTSAAFILCALFGWNRCNILIALQAVSDFLHQLGHVPYMYLAYTETLVTNRTCYFIQFVSFSACDFSTMIMLFLAVDRLLATKTPYFYAKMNSAFYVCAVVGVGLVYCAVFKVLAYETSTEDLTMCLVPEAVSPSIANVWFMSNGILNVGVTVIYGVLMFSIKNVREYEKLNKSLYAMIIVHIFGWILTMVVTLVATYVLKSDCKELYFIPKLLFLAQCIHRTGIEVFASVIHAKNV